MPVYEKKGKIDGQKVWYIRTYVENEEGKKKQITVHNKNWVGREGYFQAQQKENELRNKIITNYEQITLNDLFVMYSKYINENLKRSSIIKETDNYKLFIGPRLGNKKVFQLTTRDVVDFQSFLNKQTMTIKRKDSKRGVGEHCLSTTYKRSIHTTLSCMLKFACKYVGLQQNVASLVGNFKTPKGTKTKITSFLTSDQFNEYIQYEKNDIYKTFFTILFYSGMRRGELLALTIDDINFTTNEISIDKAINPRNGKTSTLPKTTKSNRTIKMLGVVSDVLKEYIQTSGETLFGLEKIKPTTLQRKCDNNCKKAGINQNIRIHDFRHSFASLCINNGVPVEILSEYLGHENISTTLETYSHLYPNSQDKLINILNQRV